MKKLALLLLVAIVACDANGTEPIDPDAPTNLSFRLEPSGDPNVPLGILLSWDPPTNGVAVSFDIYGRSPSTGWIRRATTTSNTFHDAGIPQQEYYVVALDERGVETGRTPPIVVDLTVRLPAPQSLTSVSLNHALQLTWAPNAVQTTGSLVFDHYRVYSSAYNPTTDTCVAPWYFEGSTVSDGFLVGNLTNGVSNCYEVSAISSDGRESIWSNRRVDTPRADAISQMMYALEARPDSAAFIFNDETPKILGVVGPTTRVDADFTLSRHNDGTFWLTPARGGSTARLYQATTVPSLTAMDRAPLTGYAATPIQVTPGMGYVFRLDEADGTHYGALRIQYITTNSIIFDWSYQNGIGNVELSAGKRLPDGM